MSDIDFFNQVFSILVISLIPVNISEESEENDSVALEDCLTFHHMRFVTPKLFPYLYCTCILYRKLYIYIFHVKYILMLYLVGFYA